MGRDTTRSGGPYFVPKGTDWWATALSARQYEAAHGPDLRRLPLGGLQHPRPSRSRNGMWAASAATVPAANMWNTPRADNILNPARMDYVSASDTCIQCHSQGRPLTNPIEGKYYDWPVGYQVGLKSAGLLATGRSQAGRAELHAFSRRHGAQEPDAGQRLRAKRDVPARRDVLQLPRRARHEELRATAQAGEPDLPGLPRSRVRGTGRAKQRSRSTRITRTARTGSACVACHMPKIEVGIPGVFVRAHTFSFIAPAMTDKYKIPNPCTSCHTDKTTAWATNEMRHWPERSPWRME